WRGSVRRLARKKREFAGASFDHLSRRGSARARLVFGVSVEVELRPPEAGRRIGCKTKPRSRSFKILHLPAVKSFKRKSPICTRRSRSVGCPIAPVIRRTCRFFP